MGWRKQNCPQHEGRIWRVPRKVEVLRGASICHAALGKLKKSSRFKHVNGTQQFRFDKYFLLRGL
jgi:hypothetical protein